MALRVMRLRDRMLLVPVRQRKIVGQSWVIDDAAGNLIVWPPLSVPRKDRSYGGRTCLVIKSL